MVHSTLWRLVLGARRNGPECAAGCIEAAVRAEIEWEAWNRCEVVNDAERESLREVLESWSGAP